MRKYVWLSSYIGVFPNMKTYKIQHGNPPAWILKYISHDSVWHTAVIVTHSNVASPNLVLLSNLPDSIDQLVFSCNETMNI